MKIISTPDLYIASSKQSNVDNYIASLDPLSFDKKATLLPELNRNRNSKELVLMLSEILPSLGDISQFDYYQSLGGSERHRNDFRINKKTQY